MSVPATSEIAGVLNPEPEAPPELYRPTGVSSSGLAAVLLTLLGWTTIPLFLYFFRHDIDAWTANGWRYAISAIIWAPWLIISHFRGTIPKGLWKAALVPSFWNAAAQVCFAWAPYYIDPPLMTFGLRLQIVFLAFGAAYMFPAERRVLRSPLFVGFLVLALAGTLTTLAIDPDGLGKKNLTGISLAIGSGVMYALYALGVRKHMVGMAPLKAFGAVSQYTALVLVVAMLVFAPNHGADAITHLTPMKFFLLVLSSVIGIGLGHTFYFYSIARLGLVVSAGVVQLQPITVSIASWFLFSKGMTGWQWTAGMIAVAGAVGMLIVQSMLSRAMAAKPRGGTARAA